MKTSAKYFCLVVGP